MTRGLGNGWWLALFVLLFAPCVAGAAKPADMAASDRAFAQLADQYFDTFYLPTNPSAATSYGVHEYDGKLEDYSRAGIDAEVKALKAWRSEEHTSELQSPVHLVCRLLLEKKKK